MLPLVRDFAEVRIVARDPTAAERLGGTPAAAPGDAGVICLTTSAPDPVLRAADVAPGTHVSSVGYAPPRGELDPQIAATGRLFVETRGAFAPPPAGCGELAGLDPASATELGDVLSGRAPGRTSAAEITVYKAMGHVAEDAAAAELAYRAALDAGLDRLAAGQAADGGWTFDWPAWSPAAEADWRGSITVDALLRLRADAALRARLAAAGPPLVAARCTPAPLGRQLLGILAAAASSPRSTVTACPPR
jgi:hypothetical protein